MSLLSAEEVKRWLTEQLVECNVELREQAFRSACWSVIQLAHGARVGVEALRITTTYDDGWTRREKAVVVPSLEVRTRAVRLARIADPYLFAWIVDGIDDERADEPHAGPEPEAVAKWGTTA